MGTTSGREPTKREGAAAREIRCKIRSKGGRKPNKREGAVHSDIYIMEKSQLCETNCNCSDFISTSGKKRTERQWNTLKRKDQKVANHLVRSDIIGKWALSVIYLLKEAASRKEENYTQSAQLSASLVIEILIEIFTSCEANTEGEREGFSPLGKLFVS